MTMNTTAPSFAGEQEQPPADDHAVTEAASSGSCVISVTGVGDDAGSIGSNSTNKTRFSFYNAQEVQKTEQEKQQILLQKGGESSASVSHENKNKNGGDQQQAVVAEDTANTEGGTSLTKSVVQVPLTTSTSNVSAISGDHHHHHHHQQNNNNNRFNFYVADDVTATPSSSAVEGGAPVTNSDDDAVKEEDDRRSPHTPLVNENDDGQHRTPAAVATTPQRTNAAAAAAAAVASAATPSSAQKKKHKAIQAAAARARNSSKIEERCNSDDDNDDGGGHGTCTATDKNNDEVNSKDEMDEINANNKMDSVEILRSLKDTEQMRYNLMKECGKEGATTKSKGTKNKGTSKIGSISSGDNINSNKSDVESHTSHEIYQDAETFDSDGLQQQAQQLEQLTATTGPMAATATDYRNTLQRPASTVMSSGAGPAVVSGSHHPGLGGGNAYEDAIREALDLLRKHRPPSPQQLLSQDTMTDDQQRTQQQANNLSVDDTNVVQGAVSSPMLRETSNNNSSGTAGVDRVLQSRWESPHDPEEVDARRKERQERMARYTSRLAELKNNDQPAGATPANENDTGTDQKGLPPLSAENILSNEHEPSRVSPVSPSFAAGAAHDLHPSACLSGDMASVGTASSLSASHYGSSAANPKEVHRSVERVLLAILERAHSNGRATQAHVATNPSSPSPYTQYATTLTANLSQASSSLATSAAGGVSTIRSDDPSFYQRGGAGGSVDERSDSPATQPPPPVETDALLRAVGDLLNTTGAGSSSVMSGASVTSPPLRSDGTERSNATAGTKRSVVEELLAEAESFGGDQAAVSSTKARPEQKAQHQQADSYNSHDLNDAGAAKSTDAEALLNCSTGVEAVHSDGDDRSTVVDKGLDDLVLKTLGKSPTKEKRSSESATEVVEEDTGDYDDEEVESQTRTGSYDDDDDDDSYDDDSDSEEDLDEALEGVLGPLSGNGGGTTGVVLESNLSPDRSIFDSLSNAMSSLVASAISGEEKGKLTVRDKYSTDMDHDEVNKRNQDGVSSSSEVDKEASELMRSLCAHLLPFGVDQSSRLLDEVPQWENENPNEAGYRIIRLTSQQLQRVEHAFEAMVHTLKKASEQNLIAEGNQSDIDASFERDLAVAEKALDGEEEGRTTAIMKALRLVPNTDKNGKAGAVTVVSDNDEDDASVDDTASSHPDVCHPDFPGIHSAGRGEMGDLEYFNLPIIFKSHVTGFEPTKDMFLEPGNVVAGQYLVENELGSAAFSTAYRCVDLNSEGDDTEDGHEEVCLKVIKNTKDFFDQSLDEIKILELLRQTGKCHENNILVMKTFFYHREHLIIVTELLRQNLFEFGKFILDHDEEPYFTLPRLGYITRQCLIALRFVHKLGLVHSDIKPENLLLASYSRAQVKVIDFGSSCYLTDRQSSYIQSRSYRAPEVVLGLPYDGKIDVWSMGCVVAEMFTGEVTFQNDSMVSMLSRIEAICGPFPRHMIAQGRQSCRFFTKCGLLFEKVSGGGDDDGQKTPDVSEDDDSDAGRPTVFDIFQPKTTTLSARLGFAADLHNRYTTDAALSQTEKQEAMFVDFVRKTLSIDPDSRPSAEEALKHPWMVYAASLKEEDIKYPSQ